MNIKQIKLTFFVTCLSLISCVTGDRSITGGPRDETPPELNEIVLKGAGDIVLIFNENINLGNQSEIVPNFDTELSYTVTKNKLKIEGVPSGDIKKIIYFNDAIKDLNENNPLHNYIYAANIQEDTFDIAGKINITLFPTKEEKVENCYVLLVKPNIGRKTLENRFNFNFNKTDNKGNFQLNFIPNPVGYDLFSFIDNNNNGKPDTGDFAGFYKNNADSDSNTNNKDIFLNYIGRNLLFTDTLPNQTVKNIYYNTILHMVNNKTLPNEVYLGDTLFNFSQVKDTFITKSPSISFKYPCEVLTPIPKGVTLSFSQASIEGNYIKLNDSTINNDTFTYILMNQDTLAKISILSKEEESEVVFINDSNYSKNVQKYLFLKGSDGHQVYELNEKLKINLRPGEYKYFIYEDNNKNGKYDPISLENLRKGDNVIKSLKDIDIRPKIDVEIGL